MGLYNEDQHDTFFALSLPGSSAADPELQHAAALLLSDTNGAASAALLARVLRNILGSPGEDKFRRLRLSNKRIQELIVDTGGGVEVLQAAGFQLVFEQNEEGAEEG